MSLASTAIVAAVVLFLSGAGGTGASLTAGAAAADGQSVIASGTAGLTVSALTLPTTALYPGLTVYGAVTAKNTGNVPLAISVSGLTNPSTTTDLSRAVVVGLGAAASSSACTTGATPPGWTGTFDSAVAGPIGATLSVGESRLLCVSVTLALTAPTTSQKQATSVFGIRIIGTQL